ncbi:carbohydrate ABC transporter permease [Humibacter ginsenosidimutans]|uniref:Sugar ABC transporter permease n=1 Tax=Humibacter ginsenosidimutans TaxID=2599293 RepID=A0A5B8M672_9MICO|nr:sugar ABC transporter permease [Humibacter ginsenosidimutans]QDZ16097.1 sugar ABC transporter permease [Humibacter ginsenosidimutans]
MVIEQQAAPAIGQRIGRQRRASRRTGWRGAFALPGFVYLLIFALYPMYQLVVMSLSDVTSANILGAWSFNGFSNFASTTSSAAFGVSVANTLILVASLLLIGLIGGTIAALALQRSGWLTNLTLGLMIFVWALPPVVAGNLWKFLLSDTGVVNSALMSTGAIHKPILWLVDSHLALLSIVLISGWLVLPFGALVVRSALLDVPQDLLEAASLDGAGGLSRFWYVTLPHLRPTLWVLAVLLVVNAFRSFDLIYVLTGGGPGNATYTLPFLAYQQAFQTFQYGIGSATSILSLLIVLALALAYGWVQRKDAR